MFKYIRVNETKQWNDEFLKKNGIGVMTATYAFDDTAPVHCCELTPSYYLRYLGVEPDLHVSDECYEEIIDAECNIENDFYMHCHVAEKLGPKKAPCDVESLEELVEEFHANPW